MSREIKFRAWDDESQVMFTYSSLEGFFAYWENSSWPLMQFTGLKDKNGVDIYEGDICVGEQYPFYGDAVNEPPTFSELNYLGEVYFWEEEAAFYLGITPVSNRVRGGACGGMLAEYQAGCQGRLKVIGNIHENPELLWVRNG